jgi:mRNA-degrading endonuclease HigB of HigAB toxin-antitoxin module
MDVKQKYTKEMSAIEITITYDLIELLNDGTIHGVIEWKHFEDLLKRITNDISKQEPMSPRDILYANYADGYKVWNLGHVFNIDGEQIFVEIYFESNKENSYIVDHYKVVSSDKFLDLLLEGKRVELSDTPVRSMA